MTTHTKNTPAPVRVDTRALRPGDTLERPLFTRHGVKLLAGGVTLSNRVLHTLLELDDTELFHAESADHLRVAGFLTKQHEREEESRHRSRAVRIRETIRRFREEGARMRPPLFEFGPVDTADPEEARRDRAHRIKRTDQIIAARERAWDRIARRIEPVVRTPQAPPPRAAARPDAPALAELRTQLIDSFRPTFAHAAAGLPIALDDLLAIIDDLAERYDRAPDRYANLTLPDDNAPTDLPSHAWRLGALCVAAGARIGGAGDDVRLLAMTGLLCDVGMAMVPPAIRAARTPLDEIGASRIHRHPAMSVALLDASPALPDHVLLGVMQHHERDDGAGYPLGLRSSDITDLARAVRVVDAYVAQTTPRPHRPALRPYDALESIILRAARDELWRPAVRALIEVVGLYPVGGYVRLSTGVRARVVGVDPSAPDRPTVAEIDDDAQPTRLVALTEADRAELSVLSAIDPPLGSSRRAA